MTSYILAVSRADRHAMPQASGQGPQSRTDARESEGMIMGLVGQRRQLVSEIERLQERKLKMAASLTGATREQATILRQTIAEVDQQLAGARTALRGIEGAIAARQGGLIPPVNVSPDVVVRPDVFTEQGVPVTAFPKSPPLSLYLSGGALTLVALSVAVGLAWARRLRRETVAAIERFHGDVRAELQKLTNGVDTMSVELERIGEGQRFVTKALVEKKEVV